MIRRPLPMLGSDLASVWLAPDLCLVVQPDIPTGGAVVEGFDSDGNHLDTLARFASPDAAVAALGSLIPVALRLFSLNVSAS